MGACRPALWPIAYVKGHTLKQRGKFGILRCLPAHSHQNGKLAKLAHTGQPVVQKEARPPAV